MIKKDNQSYAEIAKINSENESSISDIVKKEKENCATVAGAPQIAKVINTMSDKWKMH